MGVLWGKRVLLVRLSIYTGEYDMAQIIHYFRENIRPRRASLYDRRTSWKKRQKNQSIAKMDVGLIRI